MGAGMFNQVYNVRNANGHERDGSLALNPQYVGNRRPRRIFPQSRARLTESNHTANGYDDDTSKISPSLLQI
jgi:hypothetical protein